MNLTLIYGKKYFLNLIQLILKQVYESLLLNNMIYVLNLILKENFKNMFISFEKHKITGVKGIQYLRSVRLRIYCWNNVVLFFNIFDNENPYLKNYRKMELNLF